jgi:predicted AAA+ superfamily ATPase
MDFISRFVEPPASSFFLFGPRGTGKSRWLQAAFPNALRIDLLDPDTFQALQARPAHLLERVRGRPDARVVVVDEVQKVPELLPAVHLLIEEDRAKRFILTGSSPRKLKRTGADLLAGRAALRSMHPFVAAELGTRFDLREALRTGLIPLVRAADGPIEALRAYVALYLREEVQAEGLVRKLGAFARFLRAASFSHASVLSVSTIARECEVERTTVEGHLGILEDLLLAFRVPVFTRRAKRAVTSHPKLYFFDAGVFRTLRPSGPLDGPESIDGAALEGLVAQHLRAWLSWGHGDDTLSFWRTRSGTEVDFILYGPRGFFAIEVKNTARVRPADLRGLREFRSDYPSCTPLFLFRGPDPLLIDGIRCIPVESFLLGLRPGGEIGGERIRLRSRDARRR